MARSRRRHIVQSNLDYLSEELTEEENILQQLATPSEQETVCDDSGEGNEVTNDDVDIDDGEGNEDTDVDINVRVKNGAPETRGKTKLKDIWNLPKGLKIVVQCNDLNQAVGEEAGILGKFLGMIARNGSLCSLGYTDWRYVIGKKEKNTNELKVKKDMLKQVKRISEQNKKNCRKKKAIHTAGTKSFARTREKMRQKDPAKKNPHRAVVYVHTHKRKSDKNINGHVPALADASKGKTAWKGDALNQILGDDKPGRVHGLGLVPKPKEVLDVPTSRRLQNINLTTLEDNSSEDVMAVRLQMEKLEHHVKNNDAELLQLKEKTTKLEKAQMNQGGLDRASTNKEAIYVDVPNSKRRRVYGDNRSQEISMFEEGNNMDQQDNNMMNTKSPVHDENLQPPAKHSAVYKNKQSLGQNHSGKQRKITSSANKHKGNLDQNDHMQPGKSISSAYKVSRLSSLCPFELNAVVNTSVRKYLNFDIYLYIYICKKEIFVTFHYRTTNLITRTTI
uniref:Transposase Tnp1/En/Spm-like domain-containing protein n=1 Tax=Oryza punctata TaxID=4537 RepID=A0A0E0L1L5_ORYPU